MKRFLLALAGFVILMFVLRRLSGAAVRGGRGRPGRAPGRSGATELVRDRICNIFLPRDRAVALAREGEMHFFCSEQCRSRFLASLPDSRREAI